MSLQDRLRKYGIRPQKRFGQNFLINHGVIDKILAALNTGEDDHVLEIGPGPGTMTEALLAQAKTVTAVELDTEMVVLLRGEFGEQEHFTLIHDDIQKVALPLAAAGTSRIKVLGNIPYNISSPILFWLIEHRAHIDYAVLTTQREVAERVVAAPGGKNYGALSVGVQAYAQATKCFDIKPGSFWPAPKVDSSTLLIDFRDPPHCPARPEHLRAVVRQAFSQRRKMLRATLPADLLTTAEIDGTRRPESLAVAEFIKLSDCLQDHHALI